MVYGAGGLSSTAADLCRFMSSFSPYGKKILSENSIKELLRTQPTLFVDKLKGPLMGSDFGWDYSFLPDYFENPPAGSRIIIFTEGSPIYDSVVDKDEVCAPAESFMFFAGTAGDIFKFYAN